MSKAISPHIPTLTIPDLSDMVFEFSKAFAPESPAASLRVEFEASSLVIILKNVFNRQRLTTAFPSREALTLACASTFPGALSYSLDIRTSANADITSIKLDPKSYAKDGAK